MKLTDEDSLHFFRLMWSIQLFTNHQGKLFPEITDIISYRDKLPKEKKFIVRNAMWKKKEILRDYIRKNPDNYSASDLNIIKQWTKQKKQTYYIYKYLKKYAIFIGKKGVFGVYGLLQSVQEIQYDIPLPIMVEAILLPFNNKIVYDGFFENYHIRFGPGIRSTMHNEYLSAKKQ